MFITYYRGYFIPSISAKQLLLCTVIHVLNKIIDHVWADFVL